MPGLYCFGQRKAGGWGYLSRKALGNFPLPADVAHHHHCVLQITTVESRHSVMIVRFICPDWSWIGLKNHQRALVQPLRLPEAFAATIPKHYGRISSSKMGHRT